MRDTTREKELPVLEHQKTELVRQGFDPSASGDAVYFDDPSQQAYVRLEGAPMGYVFAFANCALFIVYIILGHRTTKRDQDFVSLKELGLM